MKTSLLPLSEQSSDKNLQKYYTNFQKILDFVKKQGLYEENSDFYNAQIVEVNAALAKNFDDQYDKHTKKVIIYIFRKIIGFLWKTHNFHTPNTFFAVYLSLWVSIWITFWIPFSSYNPVFLSVCVSLWITFGMIIGVVIDKKIKEDGRQIPVTLSTPIEKNPTRF